MVNPGLFSADMSGSGVAAATVVGVAADGTQVSFSAADCTTFAGRCVAAPIDLASSDTFYLTLYGTGFRGRSGIDGVKIGAGGIALETLYAGSQEEFPGVDQINVRLPHELAGRGLLDIVTTVDGVTANKIQLSIK